MGSKQMLQLQCICKTLHCDMVKVKLAKSLQTCLKVINVSSVVSQWNTDRLQCMQQLTERSVVNTL
jgi:hypothetical protein